LSFRREQYHHLLQPKDFHKKIYTISQEISTEKQKIGIFSSVHHPAEEKEEKNLRKKSTKLLHDVCITLFLLKTFEKKIGKKIYEKYVGMRR